MTVSTWPRILLAAVILTSLLLLLIVAGLRLLLRGGTDLQRLAGLGILGGSACLLPRGFRGLGRLAQRKLRHGRDVKAGCLCAWEANWRGYSYTFHPECPLHRSSLGGPRNHDLP